MGAKGVRLPNGEPLLHEESVSNIPMNFHFDWFNEALLYYTDLIHFIYFYFKSKFSEFSS